MKPDDNAALRKFILRLGLFAVVSGLMLWRRHWWHGRWDPYLYWLAAWMTFLLPALIFPALARPVRQLLQRLSHGVGTSLTWLILAGVYFLVLTPLGIAARLMGKEFLALRRDPGAKTFWKLRTEDPAAKEGWERQY